MNKEFKVYHDKIHSCWDDAKPILANNEKEAARLYSEKYYNYNNWSEDIDIYLEIKNEKNEISKFNITIIELKPYFKIKKFII